MRESGASYADKGFFEINLVSGQIEWMNDYALRKHGFTMEQAQTMTINSLVPEEFHDSMNSSIADEVKGRSQKFSIWPGRHATGKLIWWYVTKTKSSHPYHWYKAEFLNITERVGAEYAAMIAAMNTANSYNDLATRLLEHQEWTLEQIKRLDEATVGLGQGQKEMRDQIQGCFTAANRAANQSVEANQAIRQLQLDMEEQFAKQTTEILKLIGTDVVHDQRLAAFEEHMKRAATVATETAVRQISESADKAGKVITTQAHKAGQGLSRKVTIPVSAIAAAATIVQWIISNWPKH